MDTLILHRSLIERLVDCNDLLAALMDGCGAYAVGRGGVAGPPWSYVSQ